MSMGYGTFSVGGDYEGDLHRIVEVLNEWEWDTENVVRFGLYFGLNGDRIRTNIGGLDTIYPTTYPCVRLMVNRRDGTRVKLNEADDALWKSQVWDDETEMIGLSTISNRICPFLQAGALELCVEAREKECEWWSRLTICHDGCVEREGQQFEDSELVENISEKFERKEGPLARLMRGEEWTPEA